MAYQALYRKWRPEIFDDVVGQDAVMMTLKNQVIQGRVGHAYLFCGTRGTGKTSAAKILSRAVNCPNAPQNGGNPCNSCEICTSIKNDLDMSVFEIDAASNNGVDNIRDIREEVQYPPTLGRYKVYIIDEVHMLSTGAFNALLKTLEEPPQYIIFILATTDPERVPATILSRCQRYDFRRIPMSHIEKHLQKIIKNEGFIAEEKAVSYIAEIADGSMRDALSILDQCLSGHESDGLKYTDVLDVLGAPDTKVCSNLYNEIVDADVEGALSTLGRELSSGSDVMQILNDFIRYLRNVLLAGSINELNADILDISRENLDMARADFKRLDKSTLIYIINSLAELLNRARFSPQKRVLFEVELLRLCSRQNVGFPGTGSNPPSLDKANPSSLDKANPPSPNTINPPARGNTKSSSNATSEEPSSMQPPIGVISKVQLNTEESVQVLSKTEETVKVRSKTEESSPVTLETKENAALNSDIDILKSNWQQMTRKLHPSNRSLFGSVILKEENGSIYMLFKSNINYKLAASNKIENGVLKLRTLAEELTGHEVKLMARTASLKELETAKETAREMVKETLKDTVRDTVTDEELARINFPIDIEN